MQLYGGVWYSIMEWHNVLTAVEHFTYNYVRKGTTLSYFKILKKLYKITFRAYNINWLHYDGGNSLFF